MASIGASLKSGRSCRSPPRLSFWVFSAFFGMTSRSYRSKMPPSPGGRDSLNRSVILRRFPNAESAYGAVGISQSVWLTNSGDENTNCIIRRARDLDSFPPVRRAIRVIGHVFHAARNCSDCHGATGANSRSLVQAKFLRQCHGHRLFLCQHHVRGGGNCF